MLGMFLGVWWMMVVVHGWWYKDGRDAGMRRLVTSAALLGNHVGEALHLVLGTAQRTHAALDELACTLVLGVTDELHGAALVGGEAGNLAHDRADHLDALALAALAVRGARSKNSALSLVTAVDAPDET